MGSLWIENTKNNTKFPKLEKDIETEVCVIGAGLLGLTTAYYLCKNNITVTVVEAESEIGLKVSGNTTGKITSQHGLFYEHLIKDYGEKFAWKYWEANEKAITDIKNIIDENNIDCDFSWQDSYVYTTLQDEVSKVKDEVEAVKRIGGKAEFVTKTDLPFTIQGAIKFSNQAQFDARKYMLGLANQITKQNGQIYVETRVQDIAKKGKEYVLITKNANIKAKKVVIATHYPFISAPGFYFLKMYQSTSYGLAVDTKTNLFDGMYINVKEPIYSFRTATYNGKKVLVVVGADHKTGETIENDNNYAILEKRVKELYPQSEILFRWNTEDCIGLDKIPYIGEFSTIMPNVYVGTGFKKWGITSSNVAARIITDKILGKNNKYADIFNSKRLKPIKNRWEMQNMLKQTVISFAFEKADIPIGTIEQIPIDNAAIINIDGTNVGIYKDTSGNIFSVKPVCSHLGCTLTWNNLDKTWDCPCHGSRFDYMGNNIYDPANKGLELINIEYLKTAKKAKKNI